MFRHGRGLRLAPKRPSQPPEKPDRGPTIIRIRILQPHGPTPSPPPPVGGQRRTPRVPNPPRRRGEGGRIELCPSAREAQPPGGTSLNLSERHTRARPHNGGHGGARGGSPPAMSRAGMSPNPNPSSTGTSYGHVSGVKVVSRCVRRSWAGHRAFAQRHPSQKLPEPENSVFLNTLRLVPPGGWASA